MFSSQNISGGTEEKSPPTVVTTTGGLGLYYFILIEREILLAAQIRLGEIEHFAYALVACALLHVIKYSYA